MARTHVGIPKKNTTKDMDGNIIRTVHNTFLSRYVETPATVRTLQRPQNCSIIPPALFDTMVGIDAVRNTIHKQRHVSITDGIDPYSPYQDTHCNHGDVQAILPLLEITVDTITTVRAKDRVILNKTNTVGNMKVEYNILNIPDPITDKSLYRIWPTMQQHLGKDFPITGPYCYGTDPHRGHSVRVSYDSNNATRNHTWQVVKDTCIDGLPCWNGGGGDDGHSANHYIPYDNHTSGYHIVDPAGVAMVLCYAMGFLLLISLVFNMQLSNQLKRIQQQQQQQSSSSQPHNNDSAISQSQGPQPQQQPIAPPPDAFGGVADISQLMEDGSIVTDLEEPLLPGEGPSTQRRG
jgi:hypothetical protein